MLEAIRLTPETALTTVRSVFVLGLMSIGLLACGEIISRETPVETLPDILGTEPQILIDTTSGHASIIADSVNGGVDMAGGTWIRYRHPGAALWTLARVTDGYKVEVMVEGLDVAPSTSDVRLIDDTIWVRHQREGIWGLADITPGGWDVPVMGFTSLSYADANVAGRQVPLGLRGTVQRDGSTIVRFCSWSQLATCRDVPVPDDLSAGEPTILDEVVYMHVHDLVKDFELDDIWRNIEVP